MKIALGIVTWFGHGGLQRDCAAIARLLSAAGHEVSLFAARARAEAPHGVDLTLLPTRARSNHRRNAEFAARFVKKTAGFDRTALFGVLPGADVVYCADQSFIARHPHWWQRLSARYRTMARLERAVFGPMGTRLILGLAEPQMAAFTHVHGTDASRFIQLPPGLDPARRHPENRVNGMRQRLRAQFGVPEHTPLLLWVGAQPRVKGLDRVLTAMATLPSAHLALVGVDKTSAAGQQVLADIADRGLAGRVRLLGVREDVPALMAAADLLAHPARLDTTATVILEALANGLPVIATDLCGFAPHILNAKAGRVVPGQPFRQREFEEALREALDDPDRRHWPDRAQSYGANATFYQGREKAAALIAAGTQGDEALSTTGRPDPIDGGGEPIA